MALSRLRKAMAEKGSLPLTPFVGAGAASAVTGGASCASWRGLLENGIDRCRMRASVRTDWVERMQAHLVAADAISYMAVADEIRRRLERSAEGREFTTWLEESVGKLQPNNAGWELLAAIRSLSNVIVTTNYDTLLEEQGPEPELHEKWDAFSWKDDGWNSALQNGKPVVIHLHGMAAKPESVILSSADYERQSNNELNKIFDQQLFVSRRFLYIGCGDGLYDPHIAPLMEKTIRLLSAADNEKSRQLEHFLLVRGGELRHFIDHPLSDRISPVAYGTDFGALTDFLRRLNHGIDPEVSQDPDKYPPLPTAAPAAAEPAPAPAAYRTADPVADPLTGLSTPEPPVTALSLEVVVRQRAWEARAAVRRAARAMDQLAQCLVLPIGMTTWEPADQQAVHGQLAAAAEDPAADLRIRLGQAADALAAAADQAAKVTVRADPPGSAPTRLATATADLAELAGELARRVAQTHDDVRRRARTSSIRYRTLVETLDDARAEAENARRHAVRMMRRLGGLREEPAAGTGEAGNRGAADPAGPQPQPAAATSAPVEYAGDDVTSLKPEGLVAAGSGVEQSGVPEDQPQPFPSELARGGVFVVRVVGESMAPHMHDGDYLIVEKDGQVYDGDIAVLEKEGAGEREAIVKKVYFGEDKPRYESANPDYPGGSLDPDSRAAVQGKVIAVSRRIS